MKTIKSILVVVILLVSSYTFAQGPPGGRQGGQRGQRGGEQRSEKETPPPIPDSKEIFQMISDLSNELSLSEEQETNIHKLYTEHFAEVKKLTSGNSRPDREEMEAKKAAFEEAVEAELTEEQVSKYKANQKKQKKRRSKR